MKRSRLVSLFFLSLLVATGCASKRIVSQWSNPDYSGSARPFKKIMVVGITEQDAIRRNFEDRFVAELRRAGIEAVPSYRSISEPIDDGKAKPELGLPLRSAVTNVAADGVLVTRLLRVEQRADVTPGYFEPHFGFGYSHWSYPGWYGAGFYTPPRVYRYPVYYSETTLYDANKNEIVWTGTIRTIDPENANEAIENYVDTVVGALQKKHLLLG